MVNPATVPPVAADLQQRAQRLGAKLKPVHRTFGVAVRSCTVSGLIQASRALGAQPDA